MKDLFYATLIVLLVCFPMIASLFMYPFEPVFAVNFMFIGSFVSMPVGFGFMVLLQHFQQD